MPILDNITQDEGFELYYIIRSGEKSQRAWEQFGARGNAPKET